MRKLILVAVLASCAAAADTPESRNPMSRPAFYPTWATNTNYASGPDFGSPTKVAIPSGRRADGWARDVSPPPQYQNEWQSEAGSWIQYLDSGNTIAFVDLAGQTNAVQGAKVFIDRQGWYSYTTGTPFTADGLWVVTATGMGAGQWVHESVAQINLGLLAAVGPVPGGIYTPAAGRISPTIVPYGRIITAVLPAGSDSTTSTTPPSTTAGHVTNFHHVGIVNLGDIVHVEFPAVGLNSSGDFQVGAYISFDGATTWIAMSPQPGGGDPPYQQTPAGVTRALALSFVEDVAAGGDCWVEFKSSAVSAGTTTITWGKWTVYTIRP